MPRSSRKEPGRAGAGTPRSGQSDEEERRTRKADLDVVCGECSTGDESASPRRRGRGPNHAAEPAKRSSSSLRRRSKASNFLREGLAEISLKAGAVPSSKVGSANEIRELNYDELSNSWLRRLPTGRLRRFGRVFFNIVLTLYAVALIFLAIGYGRGATSGEGLVGSLFHGGNFEDGQGTDVSELVEGAYRILPSLASRAGSRIIEKDYGSECGLLSVWEKMDVFIVAHLLGWFVKALIFRDWTVLWFASIAFEVCEVGLRHILPNFRECFFDHIFLDLFGCNLLGMMIAFKVANHLGLERYHFGKAASHSSARRMSLQSVFLPAAKRNFGSNEEERKQAFGGWFKTNSATATFAFLVLGITIFDLNFFFLKAVMELSTTHVLCLLRTLVLASAAFYVVADLNKYLAQKNVRGRNPTASRRISLWRTSLPPFFLALGAEVFVIITLAPFRLPAAAPMGAFAKALTLAAITLVTALIVTDRYLTERSRRSIAKKGIDDLAGTPRKLTRSRAAMIVQSKAPAMELGTEGKKKPNLL